MLNKREILKIKSKIQEKGYALVPLKLYLKGALVKVELGICKGKHTYDKKETLKQRDINKSVAKELKNY